MACYSSLCTAHVASSASGWWLPHLHSSSQCSLCPEILPRYWTFSFLLSQFKWQIFMVYKKIISQQEIILNITPWLFPGLTLVGSYGMMDSSTEWQLPSAMKFTFNSDCLQLTGAKLWSWQVPCIKCISHLWYFKLRGICGYLWLGYGYWMREVMKLALL